jgi:Fe-S-cluster containining protein
VLFCSKRETANHYLFFLNRSIIVPAHMDMITDIMEIERHASKREKENWRFRAYLKGADFSGSRLDATVQELFCIVSERIDCRECANCCKVCSPILKRSDIQILAKYLNMKSAEFEQKYLMVEKEEDGYCFREMPCPFLNENLCSVYDQRPSDCRSFPHLQKKDFVSRLWQAVSNCSVCPIVFNVYEELKAQCWRKPR